MLTRFVHLNNRFVFVNIWSGKGKQRKLEIPGLFKAKAEALVEQKEDHIHIRPVRGEILLNGQPLEGEQLLSNEDHVILKSDKKIDEWVFQSDPAAAKAARLEQERASNIERHLPDFSGNQRHKRWLRARFQVDESGVKAKNVSRLSPFKHIPWKELDEIRFKRGGSAGGGLLLHALERGVGKTTGSSELDALFVKGLFTVTFSYQDRSLSVFNEAQARSCVLIAQAAEYYSPIDLVNMT